MRIGLYDVDGHNFPNLPLMKISAYHKAKGDDVEFINFWEHYDVVYVSKVFGDEYLQMDMTCINADEIIYGGTGFAITVENGKEVYHKEKDKLLPCEIEHIYPDYSLYPEFTKNKAYGFLTRGCCNNCEFCIVSQKEGMCSVKVADLSEWWNGQKEIVLLDPNILACKEHLELLQQLSESRAWVDFTQGLDARLLNSGNISQLNKIKTKMLHFAWDLKKNENAVLAGLELYKRLGSVQNERKRRVYVLTNFDTEFEYDLYRVYTLKELGYDPYIMIYNKPTAPKKICNLQRWVNNKFIFRSCERFEDYRR